MLLTSFAGSTSGQDARQPGDVWRPGRLPYKRFKRIRTFTEAVLGELGCRLCADFRLSKSGLPQYLFASRLPFRDHGM